MVFQRIFPSDADPEVWADIEKAFLFVLRSNPLPKVSAVLSAWYDLIVAEAVSADTMAESDLFLMNYMDSINEDMEREILSYCLCSGFCIEIESNIYNSPQINVLTVGEFQADVNMTLSKEEYR